MPKQNVILLALAINLGLPLTSWCQGIVESGAMNAHSSVLGSSLNNKGMVKSLSNFANPLSNSKSSNNSNSALINKTQSDNSKHSKYESALDKKANELYLKAVKYYDNKDYQNSIKYFQEYILHRAKATSNLDLTVIRTNLTLAQIYTQIEDYVNAQKYAKHALKAAGIKFGPGNYALKPYVEQVAIIDAHLHDYKGAAQSYERVFEFIHRQQGDKSVQAFNALMLACQNYYQLKDYEDCDELYNKALVIIDKNKTDEKFNSQKKDVLTKLIEIRKLEPKLGNTTEFEKELAQLDKK